MLVAAIAASGARPLAAQFAAGTDLTFASQYHWRGLTRASGWVLQPGVYAAVKLGSGYLTGEFWESIEFGEAGPDQLTDAGFDEGGRTEYNLSVQYLFELHDFVLGAGWVAYRFRGDPSAGGRGRDSDTHEVFGSVEWRGIDFFAPRISVWHDYDEVDGTYLEAAGSFRVPITAMGVESSFYLDVVGGYSLGQERSVGELSYFDDHGPTHVAVAPTFVIAASEAVEHMFNIPSVTLVIEPFRFQQNIDSETRRTSLRAIDQNQEVKWRILSITLSVALQ
jgi:hypothetical protein